MTCKDCIHYAVCGDRERVEKLNQNCNPPPYIRNGNFSPIGCLVFKNKADFVEVVRCGKCKHGEVSIMSKSKDGEEEIACYCNAKNKVTDLEYYCACGERRDT